MKGETVNDQERLNEYIERGGACQWFALCTNDAIKARPHPILGEVPICDRCDRKMDHNSV
jgi:hypothetical protein